MKCLSAAEGGAAWHGDCAIFSRWWSAPAAPAVGVRGSIPRVGPRGIACLTETPVLRGFSLALMPSPPASRLPPPLPLTRTEDLATATTAQYRSFSLAGQEGQEGQGQGLTLRQGEEGQGRGQGLRRVVQAQKGKGYSPY